MRINLLYNRKDFMSTETSPRLPGRQAVKTADRNPGVKGLSEPVSKKIIVELPEDKQIALMEPLTANWITLLVARSRAGNPIVSRQELLTICNVDGKSSDIDSLRSRATRTNDHARRSLLQAGFTIETVVKSNRWSKDGEDNGSYRFSKLEPKQTKKTGEDGVGTKTTDHRSNESDPYGLYENVPEFLELWERLRKKEEANATSSPSPQSPEA